MLKSKTRKDTQILFNKTKAVLTLIYGSKTWSTIKNVRTV